jgi:NAD+ synthase
MDTKDRLIRWLRQKVRDAKARGIVVGISGGVDSAVVAVLAHRAVGKNFMGLCLPCESQPEDRADARLLARTFGLRMHDVDLAPVYRVFVQQLPKGNKLAYANLKPRLRMSALYFFANTHNYLVAGTGNKSEAMMGYFTKYGDGGVDVLPLGNMLKREVRALAYELGIPERIITKPPTAGLWAGQTDEAEMGITYRELDDILLRIEGGRRQVIAKTKVSAVRRAIGASRHKRALPEVYKGG